MELCWTFPCPFFSCMGNSASALSFFHVSSQLAFDPWLQRCCWAHAVVLHRSWSQPLRCGDFAASCTAVNMQFTQIHHCRTAARQLHEAHQRSMRKNITTSRLLETSRSHVERQNSKSLGLSKAALTQTWPSCRRARQRPPRSLLQIFHFNVSE